MSITLKDGVVVPDIPRMGPSSSSQAAGLDSCPYALIIRRNDKSGIIYRLILSTAPLVVVYYNDYYILNGSVIGYWGYDFVVGESSWTLKWSSSTKPCYEGIVDLDHTSDHNTLMWTNHDIYKATGVLGASYFYDISIGEEIYLANCDMSNRPFYIAPGDWIRAIAEQTKRLTNTTETIDKDAIKSRLEALNITLQEKTVTPSSEPVEVTPDDGFYGISKLLIEAVEPGLYGDHPSAMEVEF